TGVPECAQTCLATAGLSYGCGQTDYQCLCALKINIELITLLLPCVSTSCPFSQWESVVLGAEALCNC
ncbi:hypothetical protein GQ53DRAFT_618762, partial [Thozetella sp. PMI_491]